MRDNPFATRFGVILIAAMVVSAIAGLAFAAYVKRGVESESGLPTEQIASEGEDSDFQSSHDGEMFEQSSQSDALEPEVVPAEVPPLPSYSQFPEQVSDDEVPLLLNASSPNWIFRTRIRDAYRGESDFGANAVVAMWGCGTSCSMGVVVDRTNGNVIDLPLGGEDNPYLSVYSRRGSRLLLATWEESATGSCVFEAFVLEAGEFNRASDFPKRVSGSCPDGI